MVSVRHCKDPSFGLDVIPQKEERSSLGEVKEVEKYVICLKITFNLNQAQVMIGKASKGEWGKIMDVLIKEFE